MNPDGLKFCQLALNPEIKPYAGKIFKYHHNVYEAIEWGNFEYYKTPDIHKFQVKDFYFTQYNNTRDCFTRTFDYTDMYNNNHYKTIINPNHPLVQYYIRLILQEETDKQQAKQNIANQWEQIKKILPRVFMYKGDIYNLLDERENSDIFAVINNGYDSHHYSDFADHFDEWLRGNYQPLSLYRNGDRYSIVYNGRIWTFMKHSNRSGWILVGVELEFVHVNSLSLDARQIPASIEQGLTRILTYMVDNKLIG